MSVFTSILTYAQRPSTGSAPVNPGEEKVYLLGADSMTVLKSTDGSEVRRVVNKVVFRHKGALMYCNLAIHNVASNAIEAYGNVRIVQGDTITVTGDTLFYYGNTRLAKVMGKVVNLKDKKRTVTSTRIEYDMATGIAFYPNKGKIVDAENTLTSNIGYYDTRTKVSTYYKDVKLVNKKYTLTTDTLVYNSLTKLADFKSPTKVVSKDGTVIAKNGTYNTDTGESLFRTRTTIDNPDYTLTGDSLSFDNLNKKGFAKGQVEIVSKNDDTILNGDFGLYNGKSGISKVWGHALTRSVISKDTLFMTADTLYSIDIFPDTTGNALPFDSLAKTVSIDSLAPIILTVDTQLGSFSERVKIAADALTQKVLPAKPGRSLSKPVMEAVAGKPKPEALANTVPPFGPERTAPAPKPIYKPKPGSDTSNASKPRRLIGYKNVLLYKKDLQSRCDSLIYNSLDSNITFLKKPIIWSSKYQLEADSIVAQLVDQKLRTMYLKAKSFVISQDTLLNFNQVKGRRITAYFDDSTRLQRVFVEGNGESIYYAASEANKPMGLNRVECAKMTLNFNQNQVQRIQFVGQPDGRFIPPQRIKGDDRELEGFSWRIKEKPTKQEILAKTNFKPTKPEIVKPPEVKERKPTKTVTKEIPRARVKSNKKKL
ncbi:OstA-like protein [Runella sp.]|uniref:OstA-like protein n=1 Tax=Runella sp. TaxID=1960881 RepID=UPI003D0E1986